MNCTLRVEYNKHTDEYYIIIPKTLLKKMKWKEGDLIDWKDNRDGSFILSKIKK